MQATWLSSLLTDLKDTERKVFVRFQTRSCQTCHFFLMCWCQDELGFSSVFHPQKLKPLSHETCGQTMLIRTSET